MRPREERRDVDEVVIVATKRETLDGLQRYLKDAGLSPRCTRTVDECIEASSTATVAFLFFPDDFAWEKVIVMLASIAEQRPFALRVLVTSRPDRFECLGAADGLLVVPRPSWGWALLDAIRGHVAAHADADRRSRPFSRRAEWKNH
jgi:hypothetical protein